MNFSVQFGNGYKSISSVCYAAMLLVRPCLGGYRGRAIDFSAAPKGRGAGGRRIDDHHTAVNAVPANSATGKPFRNTPGGRGRGARFLQHDARETCAKVESCAPVITPCVSSSNSVNSTAVGVLETTKSSGVPRLSASGQPHSKRKKAYSFGP